MDQITARALGGHTLLDQVRGLLPGIAARADTTERNRRVPVETIAEVRALGLFDMLLPVELGGSASAFSDFSSVTRLLATACGSTAWVFAVMTESNWIASLYPPEAHPEIWSGGARPLACASIVPFGKAEKVAGGWRVDGHWHYLSGSEHAQWAVLSANHIDASGKTEVVDVLIRKSEMEVQDDWHVLGLAGTSTNSAVVKNVFVPDSRCIPHASLLAGTAPGGQSFSNYPLGRVPRQLVTAYSLSPVIVGLATRALELGAASLRGAQSAPDWPNVQSKFAEAVMSVEIANEILDRYGAENERLMHSGEPIAELSTARAKLAASHMIRSAKHGIDLIAQINGSRWLYDSHPLQRIVRDAATAATHRSANWDMVSMAYVSALVASKPDGR
jgi:alkylation response protein AidB-like acyl-CoA dehydrogenase